MIARLPTRAMRATCPRGFDGATDHAVGRDGDRRHPFLASEAASTDLPPVRETSAAYRPAVATAVESNAAALAPPRLRLPRRYRDRSHRLLYPHRPDGPRPRRIPSTVPVLPSPDPTVVSRLALVTGSLPTPASRGRTRRAASAQAWLGGANHGPTGAASCLGRFEEEKGEGPERPSRPHLSAITHVTGKRQAIGPVPPLGSGWSRLHYVVAPGCSICVRLRWAFQGRCAFTGVSGMGWFRYLLARHGARSRCLGRPRGLEEVAPRPSMYERNATFAAEVEPLSEHDLTAAIRRLGFARWPARLPVVSTRSSREGRWRRSDRDPTTGWRSAGSGLRARSCVTRRGRGLVRERLARRPVRRRRPRRRRARLARCHAGVGIATSGASTPRNPALARPTARASLDCASWAGFSLHSIDHYRS